MSAHTTRRLRFDDIPVGRKQTLSRTITGADVDAFGHLSGDLNPLHMDAAFAAGTPFGKRVAHGLLTGAIVSTAHTELTGPGFAYVGQELKFLGPVFVGDTITVEVTVVDKKLAKRILVMDTMVRKQSGEAVLGGLSALKELRLD
ncbi:MaoC family dehydratase [Aquincola sp. S2]|uniref:MaoC family dehydratase n=1 Tax=Pseudaquabacterium terrae TaxID=2732868 RepID=A0ABX2EF25_9BURK|nr:MaoC family dehydratase [Aquabacterium terrae]NRF67208.1 MaoC family dehydratase [Aquabacterium terrae]